VGPGFDFADFDLLRQQAGGQDLEGASPQWL
jgi:predicted cupin superfamily sugar epimerase